MSGKWKKIIWAIFMIQLMGLSLPESAAIFPIAVFAQSACRLFTGQRRTIRSVKVIMRSAGN